MQVLPISWLITVLYASSNLVGVNIIICNCNVKVKIIISDNVQKRHTQVRDLP